MKQYILILFLGILATACSDYLDPVKDNRLLEEEVLENPAFAEGLLLNAYNGLPGGYNFNEDVASDDAVTNNRESNIIKMATGEWRSNFYPLSQWNYAYNNMYYINLFLEKCDQVQWSWQDEEINELHLKRLKGEAHGLRAWYEIQLLQYHGGISTTGQLLGFPIVTKPITIEDEYTLPRNTFSECVQQIYSDLDYAIANLPDIYENDGDRVHDATMGERWTNRMTANIARGLKSRVALLAASPAFSDASGVSWENAAVVSGQLIQKIGGLNALSSSGVEFYLQETDAQIKAEKEILWNGSVGNSAGLERTNFPPSLFGEGRTNPTQNLVEAFPMANGYPIEHSLSGFDPNSPYQARDPRLSKYIIFDGSSFKGGIRTYVGADKDGINNLLTSTRTGYYLKKFMNPNVVLYPSTISKTHYYTYLRMTEILLNYAESANEAWGPDADPQSLGFTARQVVAAIRQRAGISQPDDYLSSLTGVSDLRDLIRNERRLELCFEGFRFWDIRRWESTDSMSESVKGAFITPGFPSVFDYQVVEERNYEPYMIYGPIPYDETLKYDIIQNNGW